MRAAPAASPPAPCSYERWRHCLAPVLRVSLISGPGAWRITTLALQSETPWGPAGSAPRAVLSSFGLLMFASAVATNCTMGIARSVSLPEHTATQASCERQGAGSGASGLRGPLCAGRKAGRSPAEKLGTAAARASRLAALAAAAPREPPVPKLPAPIGPACLRPAGGRARDIVVCTQNRMCHTHLPGELTLQAPLHAALGPTAAPGGTQLRALRAPAG